MSFPREKIVIVHEENPHVLNENFTKVEDKLDENVRVGPLVAKMPAYASLFEKIGIDYCCNGKKTLKDLCSEKNVDVTEVLDQLRKITITSQSVDWDKIPLKELITHIVRKHHDYLREELPRLSGLIDKVTTKHGSLHLGLVELQKTFEEFKTHLLEHIEEEEKIVFPAIENMISHKQRAPLTEEVLHKHLNSLDAEHSEAGAALEKMHQLTNGYTPPKGACTTHRVMLNSLAALEKDMHEHVHKENHILFPKVLKECF